MYESLYEYRASVRGPETKLDISDDKIVSILEGIKRWSSHDISFKSYSIAKMVPSWRWNFMVIEVNEGVKVVYKG